jgi:hypothetical protein
MTEEDEEFNRIEMESRIKQNYVRDIKKPSREALLAEVAVLTEMVRVLSARVAELEAKRAIAELESQEPVAYLVLFEGAGKLLEFKKGNYIHGAKVEHIPLYVKPQIEVGCAECGVNGGHALYCVACTEKFDVVVSKAVEHEREECAGIDIPVTVPNRDYLGMSPLEIYEEALMDATLSFRAAIRARKNTHPPQRTWVGLTDADIAMWRPRFKFSEALIREVEAKLKEKNNA